MQFSLTAIFVFARSSDAPESPTENSADNRGFAKSRAPMLRGSNNAASKAVPAFVRLSFVKPEGWIEGVHSTARNAGAAVAQLACSIGRKLREEQGSALGLTTAKQYAAHLL
jgi:hypothetical protein